MHTWAYRGNLGALRIDHHSLVAEFTLETSRSRVRRTSRLKLLSKDPILFNGGQANLYSYIEDEPINQVDPMGTGPLAALTCAASLLVFSTPAILDSAYNNYEIERLKSAKSSTSDCPPTAKNNIDNQIEKLRDQNRAADEYMQSLTDMRGICYSLIFTPGP